MRVVCRRRTQTAVYLTGNHGIDRFCLAAHNDRLCLDAKRLEHRRRNNVLVTARAGGSCIGDLMRFAVVDQIIKRLHAGFLRIEEDHHRNLTHTAQHREIRKIICHINILRSQRKQRTVGEDQGVTVRIRIHGIRHADGAGSARVIFYNDRLIKIVLGHLRDLTGNDIGTAADTPRTNDRYRTVRIISRTCRRIASLCTAAAAARQTCQQQGSRHQHSHQFFPFHLIFLLSFYN